jgi:hypothetical protein
MVTHSLASSTPAISDAYAVILSYSILGAFAWLWFTRTWSVTRRLVGVLAFVSIWSVATWHTTRDSNFDADLGIQPSSLTFPDAALWSLPLALALWLAFLAVVFILRRFRRSVHERANGI